MTTIAWDGTTLAADRLVTFGYAAEATMTKIARRADGALIGAAGTSSLCAAVLRWFCDGGDAAQRPSVSDDKDNYFAALVIAPDGALTFHDRLGWHRIEAPFLAIGSGCDYATGAMAHGASAAEAIEIASRFDTKSGAGVDVLRLVEPAEEPWRRFADNPPLQSGVVLLDARDADGEFLALFIDGLWREVSAPNAVDRSCRIVRPRCFHEWRPTMGGAVLVDPLNVGEAA